MAVVSILLAVAAATAAIVLAVRVRRQGVALGAAADRAAALEAELDRTRSDRAVQTVRADTAEAERNEALASARATSSELQVAVGSLNEATRARDTAVAALEALRAEHASCVDAAALWSLELSRVERRWHLSVAPGIGLTSPLATTAVDEHPRVAVEILAAALREETGTRFEIDWALDQPLPTVTALLVVRTADELLSSAALSAERVVLTVRSVHDGVSLERTAYDTDDAVIEPGTLDAPAFADPRSDQVAAGAPGSVHIPLATDRSDVAA